MAKEFRVGIIGCGNVSGGHASAFAGIDDVKIVAACDLEIDKALALADKYGANAYADYDEMLRSEELDIVDVVTREGDRLEPLRAAIEAGKHVFCEKPLAGKRGQVAVRWEDVEAAKPVIDAWKKAGTFFGINFNYHTSPTAMRLKEAIDDGTIGEIVGVNARVHLWCTSHVIDLMRWFAGDVAELTATVTGPDASAHRGAVLKFVNGAVGTLMGTLGTSTADEMLRVEVIGNRCRAVMIDLAGRIEFYPYSLEQREVLIWENLQSEWRAGFDKTFEHTIVNYMNAVKAGQPPPITGTDAIRELEIDAGIFVSAETGKPFKPELYG